jgi:hypothetical protein
MSRFCLLGVSRTVMIRLMTTQPVTQRPYSGSLREQVAEDVRAELARKRVSGVALATMLGKSQGQPPAEW